MKTNHYESVVIVNAALEDPQIEETLSRIEETLKTHGAEISENEKWGRKRLAYPIQKSKSGYYSVYRFSAPTDIITELERMYRLDENIIRYLTIQLDKKAVEHYEKLKHQKETAVVEKPEVPAAAEKSEQTIDSEKNDKDKE